QLVTETSITAAVLLDRIRRNRDDKAFYLNLMSTSLKVMFGIVLCSLLVTMKSDFYKNHPMMLNAVTATSVAYVSITVCALLLDDGVLFKILAWLVPALQLALVLSGITCAGLDVIRGELAGV
ncbi:hypothetical protein M8C21_002383, partial [Ambrosia artemisiifolia]